MQVELEEFNIGNGTQNAGAGAGVAIACSSVAVAVGVVLVYFLVSYWIEARANRLPMWEIMQDDLTNSRQLLDRGT